MPRFLYELAEATDDAELRQVLAATPMDGAISLSFAREPSYFAAAEVDGQTVQIGVVRDQQSGRIVGMGSRAISNLFVNGREQAIGYLSGLRLLPEYRSRAGLLARGYAFLRELHQDRRAPYYLTTIADDNKSALRLLTSRRAGLPFYHYLGRYVTLAMTHGRGNHSRTDNTVQLRPAESTDRNLVASFLRECGPRRQFFPALDARSLFSKGGRLRQLHPQDTLLAFRDGELIGTLGFWNQSAFKQIVVNGYEPWLRMARPIANGWSRLRHRPQLPAAGDKLEVVYAAVSVVRDDDTDVFHQLVTASPPGYRDRRKGVFLLGLFETDPLLAVARRYAAREYVTRLYVVHWNDESPDIPALARRVPYLELGCL